MLRVTLLLCLASTATANPLDHFRTDDVGPHKVPHQGTVSVLVIPTRVGPEFPADRLAELREIYDPDGGPGTFRGYWRAVSNGAYDPVPVLADPILFDRCPLPDTADEDCVITLTDLALLTNGGPQAYFGGLLEAVRDVQGIDLAQFDTSGAAGEADGFFDGVLVDSDLVDGVGLPLTALTVPIEVAVGAGKLVMGNVAMIPPDNHEFGHLLGFIDLYNGPTINDLMGATPNVTLSAFSRQQIGWGQTEAATGSGAFELTPVMAGGGMLRLGEPPRYLLVEHRGGAAHAEWDRSPPGIYVYAVDEDTLPKTLLGFLDVPRQTLYFPNAAPPYLNVNLPVDCVLIRNRFSPRAPDCVIKAGQSRTVSHPGLPDQAWTLEVEEAGAERLRVTVEAPAAPAPDAGADGPPADAAPIDAADAGAIDPPGGSEQAEDGGGGGGCQAATGFGSAWIFALLVAAMRRRGRA